MAQTKTLDITPQKSPMQVIDVSQNDVGREILIHIKDGATLAVSDITFAAWRLI